ncbi:Pol Polyprotein [Phytophthora megakarya]|uniref:Pol Polyprotein n=1 Tax=Phytophthora megakarya TaxID=4795 RepID=A0A225WX37_9STRA|nr:Pol Polyprotein [Phytophthora megakarya]
MSALGLINNFKVKVVQWDDNSYRLNTGRGGSKGHEPSEPDEQQEDLYPGETKEIADGAVHPEQLLPELQDAELAQKYLDLLVKHQELYGGHLGHMRFDDYLIPISPDYKPAHAKPYAIPPFFLVKKDGSLRLLIDYRWFNKFLCRSPYYVPRIREILMRLAKPKCISTFDANLGYYARRLARQSRPLTAFCLPFGKFQYKRLPMGISTSPDEYQACMERIFGDLEFVVVYLNEILVFSKAEEEHLEHLRVVLSVEGVKPKAKKIQAIQQIAVPRNCKELRRFLGMINYYRDMVPYKTTLCKPLQRFTSSKVPGTQHGGLVMQETKILAYYSRTLNKHQINYTAMELVLLSIVELLREYRTMLLGFPVVVHTDHKNLIYPTATNLRVKRWKLLLSEYRLSLHYIEGVKNVGADAFSRMRFATDKGKSLYEEICAATEAIECVMHGPVIRQH